MAARYPASSSDSEAEINYLPGTTEFLSRPEGERKVAKTKKKIIKSRQHHGHLTNMPLANTTPPSPVFKNKYKKPAPNSPMIQNYTQQMRDIVSDMQELHNKFDPEVRPDVWKTGPEAYEAFMQIRVHLKHLESTKKFCCGPSLPGGRSSTPGLDEMERKSVSLQEKMNTMARKYDLQNTADPRAVLNMTREFFKNHSHDFRFIYDIVSALREGGPNQQMLPSPRRPNDYDMDRLKIKPSPQQEYRELIHTPTRKPVPEDMKTPKFFFYAQQMLQIALHIETVVGGFAHKTYSNWYTEDGAVAEFIKLRKGVLHLHNVHKHCDSIDPEMVAMDRECKAVLVDIAPFEDYLRGRPNLKTLVADIKTRILANSNRVRMINAIIKRRMPVICRRYKKIQIGLVEPPEGPIQLNRTPLLPRRNYTPPVPSRTNTPEPVLGSESPTVEPRQSSGSFFDDLHLNLQNPYIIEPYSGPRK